MKKIIKKDVDNGIGMNAYRDGAKYVGKNIYVVGGADGAIKEALYLSQFANKVTVIHFEDKLGCIVEFKNKVNRTSNIELMLNTRLVKVYGEDHVNALDVKSELDGKISNIEDDGCGIFLYAGLISNTQLLTELDITKDGYINVDNKMKTNIDGVYACGDIINKQVRQVATAVNDGAVAAINAANYIK